MQQLMKIEGGFADEGFAGIGRISLIQIAARMSGFAAGVISVLAIII